MSEKSEKRLLELVFEKNAMFVIIGQSACGKGTQLKLMMSAYKKLHPDKELAVIGTGEEFVKEFPKMKPEAAKKLETMQKEGRRQSFSIAVMLWVKKILFEYDVDGPIVIDGSPRSEDEARALLSFCETFGKKMYVLSIDVSRDEAERRMMERNRILREQGKPIREDCSNPESIKTKLDFYSKDVVPAIRFLSGNGALILNEKSTKETKAEDLHDRYMHFIRTKR